MTPDPQAAGWAAVAAEIGADAQQHVAAAFDWLQHGILIGDDRAGVVTVIAVADLDQGRDLRAIIYDVLIAYEHTARQPA